MGSIILLALAAAVYPQLLAVVVIILTRPSPLPLLWACYLASLVVSVGSSVLILVAFQSRASVAGTSSQRLGPAAYLTVGVIAVAAAILIARRRGTALLDRDRPATDRKGLPALPGSALVARTRARADRSLSEGSLVFAAVAGAILAVPGPFDLIALGRLVRNGDGLLAATIAMGVFALIKFALIEAPIAFYTFDPDRTSARVARLSGWMHANKLAAIAAVVGLFGLVLIGRGIAALA